MTQVATLSNSRIGIPIDVTLTAAVTHIAVTQGPFPAGGGGIAHPAMTCGDDWIQMGIPDTVTRGSGATGTACPPCMQRTWAPK
jgi:hypothetical protein